MQGFRVSRNIVRQLAHFWWAAVLFSTLILVSMKKLAVMPVVQCPAMIRNYVDGFKDLVGSVLEYQILTALVCAAVLGGANISDMFRMLQFCPSISSVCSFLSKKGLADKLNRRHRRRLLRLLLKYGSDPARYAWALDDTVIPHSGRSIWGTYSWKVHGKTVYGHKLLVLGLIDRKRKLLMPMHWEILHRQDQPNTPSGYQHEKNWQVALRLIDAVIDFGFPILPLAADSGFSGKEFFGELEKRRIPFVIEIISNRKVKGTGWCRICDSVVGFFKTRKRSAIWHQGKRKYAAEAIVKLADLDKNYKAVAVANSKSLANAAFAYYATNQLAWNASTVWSLSRDRWTIEVQFRDEKQNFALGGAAVRSKEAVETNLSISVMALTVVRLEQLARAEEIVDQHVRPETAGQIVQEIKLSSMQKGISKLASDGGCESRKVLNMRLSLENRKRKPAFAHKTQYVPRKFGTTPTPKLEVLVRGSAEAIKKCVCRAAAGTQKKTA